MPERPRHPGRGILLVLLAVCVFSCMDATAKYLAARHPLPMLVWARYTVHFLLIHAIVTVSNAPVAGDRDKAC